jgi:CubicO group peptidase (beta-lactamase class C family)
MRTVTTLGLILTGTLTSLTQPMPTADQVRGDIGTRVDAYLTRLVPFGWSGAVLVARDGEIVLNKGYGLANRAKNIPWTSDTVGNIGSITKQFTAAAILKLEAAGKLHVEDPMAKFLPGVPADKAAITLHQLLTHSSGLRGDLGGADEEPIGRDALVGRVLGSTLAHRPGEVFEYSNEGYSLLAAIVERVSTKSYEAFLHDELFVPAGMTKTGYLLPAYADDELARGYRADGTDWGLIYKRGWRADGPGWYLTGNGGIQSTTGDLYRWHLALGNDSVLSATERAKLVTPYVPTPGGDVYAYGWGVEQTPRGTTVISHNGGNGIFFADFRRYVDEKTVIIVLGNTPVIPATFLAMNRVEPLVFNPARVPMPPAIAASSAASRAPLAGTYQLASGGAVTIAPTVAGVRVDTADLTVAALLQGFVPPGGRFADLEQKTRVIVAASAKGDFQPVVDAYNGERTLAQVRAGQGQDWADWTRAFGDFTGFDLLGETFVQGDPVVVVRLRFAHGSAVAEYPWGPRRLVGFMGLEALPVAEFLPESPTSYVHFDYRRPTPVRLVFTETAHEVQVQISGDGGTIVAKRAR